jgi:hypothetical protein
MVRISVPTASGFTEDGVDVKCLRHEIADMTLEG